MSAEPEDFEMLMAHYDLSMFERDEKLRREERERILAAIEAEFHRGRICTRQRLVAVIAKLREGE